MFEKTIALGSSCKEKELDSFALKDKRSKGQLTDIIKFQKACQQGFVRSFCNWSNWACSHSRILEGVFEFKNLGKQ